MTAAPAPGAAARAPVVVGMSGGVDSSVAALLLLRAGESVADSREPRLRAGQRSAAYI